MKSPLMPLIVVLGMLLPLPARAQAPEASPPKSQSPAPFFKEVGLDEAEQLLKKNPEVVVLDVRTPREFEESRLKGAKNIDFYGKNFESQLSELDKKKVYLVHCAAGGRSAKARDLMKKLQFTSVYHLKDGFKAWEKAGKPVVR